MTACEVRLRGRLCGNEAVYVVTTMADRFLTCEEHVGMWRVRPKARIERLASRKDTPA